MSFSFSACFWCGDGSNALCHVIHGYEPCSSCNQKMESGICIIEAVEDSDLLAEAMPVPMRRDPELYSTGRWWVVKQGPGLAMFGEKARVGHVAVTPDLAKRLGLYCLSLTEGGVDG